MTLNFKSKKTYIIAEAGVNHNGNMNLARKLVLAAKKAGADAVKFQTFTTSSVVTKFAEQAPYQIKNMKKKEKQFDMLKKYELKNKDFFVLKAYCQKIKIDFISSVFDEQGVSFLLNKIGSKVIKLPSGEINNLLILKKLKLSNYKILISTGMSNYQDIINAINTIAKKQIYKLRNQKPLIINKEHFKKVKKNICIMHCVTDYPVSKDQANLKCIDNIKNDFNLITGYSDHTLGILAATIAVTKGATIIEKHLTLNKKMQGPDHLASLEPKEFLRMVENIREFELMNGNGKKKLQECEIRNLKVARKSIIAKIAINKNEIFTFKNLTVKRPGTGLNPFMIEKLINKKSKKKYYADQIIEKQ